MVAKLNKITKQDNSKLSFEDWLYGRNKGIGASEIGAIVFGSRWTSNLEIFYNKVTGTKKNAQNIRTYIGKKTENINREMYCFYDQTEDSIWQNELANNPVKEVINHNATYWNCDYPHLFVTPDGEIQNTLKYAGKGLGSLELKNSQRMVLNSYEGGIPTDNIFQVVAQMMVPEYSHADLFFYLDNRHFEEHHFVRKEVRKMEETILAHTIPFWENVLKARPLYNQLYECRRNYQMKQVAELEVEIANLEPPIQNSQGYADYLTDHYKDRISEGKIIPGTIDQLLIAQKHKKLVKQIDKLKKEKEAIEIDLKTFLKHNHTIDFGKQGKVTWFPTKTGNRLFKNNTK